MTMFAHWNIQDVLSALSPLFPISRILGVLPYSQVFAFSRGWLIYSLMIQCSLTGFTVYNTILSLKTPSKNDISQYLQHLEVALTLMTILVHLLRMFLKRSVLNLILRRTIEIDTFWVIYTRQVSRLYFTLGVAWLSAIIALMHVNNPKSIPSYLTTLTHGSTSLIFFSIAMDLCSFLELLRSHLSWITDQLKPDKSSLSTLIETHAAVSTLAREINEFYSWQILCICVRSSVTFVFDIFLLLKVVSSVGMDGLFLHLAELIASICWDFSILFSLAASCSNTTDKLKNFHSVLFKVIRSQATLYKNDKLRLYTILQDNHEFDACGFFTVGYPLITSVIGATTTYVVILVQFLFDTGTPQDNP